MNSTSKRVIFIENDRSDENAVRGVLKDSGQSKFHLVCTNTPAGGLRLISSDKPDALLMKLDNNGSLNLETLKQIKNAAPYLPIVTLVKPGLHELGFKSVQGGAQDFLYTDELVGPSVEKSISLAIERKQIEMAKIGWIAQATQKMVSEEVLKQVTDSPDGLSDKVDQLLVTVLFADVRGFTHISEQYPKETVIKLLNHLLEEMSLSVYEEGGHVDKFLGDGLMAIFGAPKLTDNDWLHAARAAFKMQARIDLFNRRRLGLFPELAGLKTDVQVGVGIHSGTATVGFINTSDRCEYTAIGDCVNVASRLCSEARGEEILLTKVVADGVGADGDIGDWRLIQLKGKAVKTEVGTLRSVNL